MSFASTPDRKFSFLTAVPRGLQDVAARTLQAEAQAFTHKTKNRTTRYNDDAMLQVSIWGQDRDADVERQVIEQLSLKQEEKKKRRLQAQKEGKHEDGRQPKKDASQTDGWFSYDYPLGSTPLESTGQHVSMGYTTTSNSTVQPCWSCSGQMQGSVWMKLHTNSRDISQFVITKSRCFGPVLAVATVQTDNACLTTSNYHTHSLEELVAEVAKHIQDQKTHIATNLQTAMRVWQDCFLHQWKDQIKPDQFDELHDRITKNQLKFRISCLRQQETDQQPAAKSHSARNKNSDTSDFAYTRQELCRKIMDTCGVDLVPFYFDQSGKIPGGGSWKVDLQEYDVEMVLIILPGIFSIGISLRPYPFVKSRSFVSGAIPPDISPPFLGGKVLADVIKLRSTTARLLLEVAELEDFDVVLDPCAGIGTIPLEVDQYFKTKSCVGIGGDLVLNNPTFTRVAKMYTSNNLMVACDAAYLPLGTATVDAVVSDLPFGQKCLSLNTLNQLLPLVFYECARVLRPDSGRMILLCGATPQILVANLSRLSGSYWKQPIRRISPVNIGGILAWIVRVERNGKRFGDGDDELKHRYRECLQRLTEKRDRIGRHRHNEAVEQRASKRRRK